MSIKKDYKGNQRKSSMVVIYHSAKDRQERIERGEIQEPIWKLPKPIWKSDKPSPWEKGKPLWKK